MRGASQYKDPQHNNNKLDTQNKQAQYEHSISYDVRLSAIEQCILDINAGKE
jgi:hypothetical protein